MLLSILGEVSDVEELELRAEISGRVALFAEQGAVDHVGALCRIEKIPKARAQPKT